MEPARRGGQAGTHIFSLPPLAQSLMSALVDILRAAVRECRRALTLRR